MLGAFLNHLTKAAPAGIPVSLMGEAGYALGTAVVAVENASQLKMTGLPSGVRYGILTHGGKVICQVCEAENFSSPEFRIVEKKLEDFCPRGWHIHIHPQQSADSEMAHKKAVREIGTSYRDMRSYPGDDFVEEIISGNVQAHLNLCRENAFIGQHWWTPLYYTLEELRQLAQEATGVQIPIGLAPVNPELLHLRHHGIVIEDNWVIHFANCRVPDKTNQVKLDTLETFCSITPSAEEKGGPLNYRNDDEFKRQLHRNRAVWILFHANTWGKYNLITNNCEHLSRMCKVGRKESAQVKKGGLSIAGNLLLPLLPGGVIVRTLASLGIPYLLNEILNHRIIKESNPPRPFE